MTLLEPDFSKSSDGLLPAIIQDYNTRQVLMLGFMNQDALRITLKSKRVTFYSRSKKRLWTKGEESKNYLLLKKIQIDCDKDTLLIKAVPAGPVCHTGRETCFEPENEPMDDFLYQLEDIIRSRKRSAKKNSYTSFLMQSGMKKIAQKVGEEAIEMILEAGEKKPAPFLEEAADLLYHFMVLLVANNCSLDQVNRLLRQRHLASSIQRPAG